MSGKADKRHPHRPLGFARKRQSNGVYAFVREPSCIVELWLDDPDDPNMGNEACHIGSFHESYTADIIKAIQWVTDRREPSLKRQTPEEE